MMTCPTSNKLQDFSASDNGQYKTFPLQFSSSNMCFSSLRQRFAKNTDHCYELLKICNPLFCKLRVLDIYKCIMFSFCVHNIVSILHIKPKILYMSNIYKKVEGVTRRCSTEQTNTGFLNAIFTPNARQGFLLKFGTKIYEVILYSCMKCCKDQAILDHAGPNVACIVKGSCEITTSLRYHAALSGNSLLTLPISPIFKVKKSKREDTA